MPSWSDRVREISLEVMSCLTHAVGLWTVLTASDVQHQVPLSHQGSCVL